MSVDAAERPSWGFSAGDLIVPHCTVRARLGGGHDFETYSAVDDRMLTPVAIKIVRPDMVTNEAARQGLSREAVLTYQFRHPLIVRSYYAELDVERPYVAMEMLPGEPLDAINARVGRLDLPRTLTVGLGLAAALHYLAGSSIVHLDVRPANIILGSVPRLIDFNQAFPADQAALLTGQVGTRGYLAPEQCSPPDTGVPSLATDIWGLGATLFRCISGRRPFAMGSGDPTDPLEVQFPTLVDDLRDLPHATPPGLADIVRSCLAKAPQDRPTAKEVFSALERVKAARA